MNVVQAEAFLYLGQWWPVDPDLWYEAMAVLLAERASA